MNKNILEFKQDVRSKDIIEDEKSREHWKIYVDFVENIVNKMSVVRRIQVSEMLKKNFEELASDNAMIDEIIYDGEYKYLYIISSDEYLINYEYYKEVTGDSFYDGLQMNAKIKMKEPFEPYIAESEDAITRLKVMSLIANLGRVSANFIRCSFPWEAMFTHNVEKDNETKGGFLCQIAYFSKEDIITKGNLIKDAYRVDDRTKKNYKRYAIVESDELASQVPYCGFKVIVKINENYKVEILEKRETPWQI